MLNSRYLIAEIGVNHEGDLDLAKRQIFLAAEAGAQAVKFQSYKAEKISAVESPAYWDLNEEPTTNQRELFSKYDKFGEKEYRELASVANENGVDFLSTPFDVEAVEMLSPLVSQFKISSSDITNFQLIDAVLAAGKPVILSTGASHVWEISRAVERLGSGIRVPLTLLHCVLSYPTLPSDANLGAIVDLAKRFPECAIGYSDHTKPTKSMDALCLAYSLGAIVIEKHFTHDKSLSGNDHYHSMDASDVRLLNSKLDYIDLLRGDNLGGKRVLDCEEESRKYARRSLYADRDLSAGEALTTDCIISLRPVKGVDASSLDMILGKRLVRDVAKGESLHWQDLELQ